MIYRYFGLPPSEINIKEILFELDAHIINITVGGIIVGYSDGFPLTRKGVEIELMDETPELIEKLDVKLLGLRREGGRSVDTVVLENVVTTHPNPIKQAYKLSQLYGLTHEQLDTHIDGISNLAEAKEFMRKMAHVVLYLVKQTKLDEI